MRSNLHEFLELEKENPNLANLEFRHLEDVQTALGKVRVFLQEVIEERKEPSGYIQEVVELLKKADKSPVYGRYLTQAINLLKDEMARRDCQPLKAANQ